MMKTPTNIPLEDRYEIKRLYIDEDLSFREIVRRTGHCLGSVVLCAKHEPWEWDSELRMLLDKSCYLSNSGNRFFASISESPPEPEDTPANVFATLLGYVMEDDPPLSYREKINRIKQELEEELKK